MGDINFAALNVVDIVILVIFFISIIIGFGRGLVSEVLSLVILIAAFAVAIIFTNPLATYFASTSVMQNVANANATAAGTTTISYMTLGISFVILFLATLIVGGILKMLLNLIFQRGILGVGNRLLGAVFGILRGYLINLVMIFFVQLSPYAAKPWWQQSQLVPLFQPQVLWLGNMVSSTTLADLKSTFNAAADKVKDKVTNEKKEPEKKKDTST